MILDNNCKSFIIDSEYLSAIDKDRDGTFDIVPDGIANWGTFDYSSNLCWQNINGKFVRNN